MGRKAREFTAEKVREMVWLFNAGYSAERVGEACGCSALLARRALKAELGDLRIAAAMRKVRRGRALGSIGEKHASQIVRESGERPTSKEYREGFEAGCRQALTLVNLHGLEATRVHCNEALLSWRDFGMYGPPALVRSP